MKANFGFKQVEWEEKAALVGSVFSSVAGKYDLMNDLMSFGLHRLWKNEFVSLYSPKDGHHILDVAGGTGDIAFRLYDKIQQHALNVKITVYDINKEMLEIGKTQAIDKGILSSNNCSISWKEGDGENLPFKDNMFDCYTIAFGIRNFTDINKGLTEAKRVLKPGGQFLCMEFLPVKTEVIKQIYDFYSFNIIPKIGEVITKNKEAYQYLVESIRKFPDKQKFAHMIESTGFSQVRTQTLAFGAVAIHSAWRI